MTAEEYLHSSYEPDVDYVDGHLEERNLGEFDRGDLQLELGTLLRNKSEEWAIRVVAETRVQVSPTRFRVPRGEDFLRMGVPEIWSFDPARRTASVLSSDGLHSHENAALTLAGTTITLDLPSLFRCLIARCSDRERVEQARPPDVH